MANLLKPNVTLDLKASFFKRFIGKKERFLPNGALTTSEKGGIYINSLNN